MDKYKSSNKIIYQRKSGVVKAATKHLKRLAESKCAIIKGNVSLRENSKRIMEAEISLLQQKSLATIKGEKVLNLDIELENIMDLNYAAVNVFVASVYPYWLSVAA